MKPNVTIALLLVAFILGLATVCAALSECSCSDPNKECSGSGPWNCCTCGTVSSGCVNCDAGYDCEHSYDGWGEKGFAGCTKCE